MDDIKLSAIMQHIISHACNADHRSNGHITIKQALAMYNIITTTDTRSYHSQGEGELKCQKLTLQ